MRKSKGSQIGGMLIIIALIVAIAVIGWTFFRVWKNSQAPVVTKADSAKTAQAPGAKAANDKNEQKNSSNTTSATPLVLPGATNAQAGNVPVKQTVDTKTQPQGQIPSTGPEDVWLGAVSLAFCAYLLTLNRQYLNFAPKKA